MRRIVLIFWTIAVFLSAAVPQRSWAQVSVADNQRAYATISSNDVPEELFVKRGDAIRFMGKLSSTGASSKIELRIGNRIYQSGVFKSEWSLVWATDREINSFFPARVVIARPDGRETVLFKVAIHLYDTPIVQMERPKPNQEFDDDIDVKLTPSSQSEFTLSKIFIDNKEMTSSFANDIFTIDLNGYAPGNHGVIVQMDSQDKTKRYFLTQVPFVVPSNVYIEEFEDVWDLRHPENIRKWKVSVKKKARPTIITNYEVWLDDRLLSESHNTNSVSIEAKISDNQILDHQELGVARDFSLKFIPAGGKHLLHIVLVTEEGRRYPSAKKSITLILPYSKAPQRRRSAF